MRRVPEIERQSALRLAEPVTHHAPAWRPAHSLGKTIERPQPQMNVIISCRAERKIADRRKHQTGRDEPAGIALIRNRSHYELPDCVCEAPHCRDTADSLLGIAQRAMHLK